MHSVFLRSAGSWILRAVRQIEHLTNRDLHSVYTLAMTFGMNTTREPPLGRSSGKGCPTAPDPLVCCSLPIWEAVFNFGFIRNVLMRSRGWSSTTGQIYLRSPCGSRQSCQLVFWCPSSFFKTMRFDGFGRSFWPLVMLSLAMPMCLFQPRPLRTWTCTGP